MHQRRCGIYTPLCASGSSPQKSLLEYDSDKRNTLSGLWTSLEENFGLRCRVGHSEDIALGSVTFAEALSARGKERATYWVILLVRAQATPIILSKKNTGISPSPRFASAEKTCQASHTHRPCGHTDDLFITLSVILFSVWLEEKDEAI